MKTRNYVVLYVCPEIRVLIENKVQELKGVNPRLYTNKLLFILSRLHWKQVHHPGDFANNGAKLRTAVSAETRRIKPEAEKTTLLWYLRTKGGKVTNMIETLVEWGIIKMKHNYQKGISARTYTFTDKFMDCDVSLEEFYSDKDGAFVRKLLQERTDREQQPIIQAILNIYNQHVSLSDEGLRYIQGLYGRYPVINDIAEAHRRGCFDDNRESLLKLVRTSAFATDHLLLMKLFLKDYYASVGPQNRRVDHNLTNLKREYRKFVLIDGKPMLETDIVNCQPALAAGLINHKLREMHGEHFVANDMVEYERYCKEGRFYEVLAEKAGIEFNSPISREIFKKRRFYPEVFYCKNNNWNTATQVAFRTMFPNADSAIRELKKKDHSQFSIELQKLESDAVVHSVFVQLVKEGYKILPLHDAIYTNDESIKEYAQELIRQVIREKHGIGISFKGEVDLMGKVVLLNPTLNKAPSINTYALSALCN